MNGSISATGISGASCFCYLLCCMFWWNPFLWLLKNKMDQLLELRCYFSVLEKIDTVQQDDYLDIVNGNTAARSRTA